MDIMMLPDTLKLQHLVAAAITKGNLTLAY